MARLRVLKLYWGYAMNRQQPTNPKYPLCTLCRTEMQPLMRMPVRVGGPESGFVLFRQLQEMGETILMLDTYRCPRCGKLEFFDLDLSLPQR